MNNETDVFIELLVKKRLSSGDRALLIAITIGGALLVGALVILSLVLPSWLAILFLAECGAIYGWWKLINQFRVEYEYALTNAELDVDKIIAQAKRRRLITVDFQKIDILAPAGGEHRAEYESGVFQKTIDASVAPDAKGTYFLITQHAKYGRTRLLFNPDERILKGAKTFARLKVYDS